MFPRNQDRDGSPTDPSAKATVPSIGSNAGVVASSDTTSPPIKGGETSDKQSRVRRAKDRVAVTARRIVEDEETRQQVLKQAGKVAAIAVAVVRADQAAGASGSKVRRTATMLDALARAAAEQYRERDGGKVDHDASSLDKSGRPKSSPVQPRKPDSPEKPGVERGLM